MAKRGGFPVVMPGNMNNLMKQAPVSYTHLDVYKRQIYDFWQLSEKNQKQEKMEIKILNKIYKNTCFFETAML